MNEGIKAEITQPDDYSKNKCESDEIRSATQKILYKSSDGSFPRHELSRAMAILYWKSGVLK